jgi:hypothetical protein
MTWENPFPMVRGKQLADACVPPLDLDLPDYRLVPAPEGIVVLVPAALFCEGMADEGSPRTAGSKATPDLLEKDSRLSAAFMRLKGLVSESRWTASLTPYGDLERSFAAAADNPNVTEDLTAAVLSMPSLVGVMETFFSAIAMAASAEWWRLPAVHQGAAARGWFIGRWLPTALVVDGPIVRFIRSKAFRRLEGENIQQVRAVRRFLGETAVVAFRHALAHWSFTWETRDDGSYVVCHGALGKPLILHQEQADAIHILTFAIVDVLFDRCLSGGRVARIAESAMENGDQVQSRLGELT